MNGTNNNANDFNPTNPAGDIVNDFLGSGHTGGDSTNSDGNTTMPSNTENNNNNPPQDNTAQNQTQNTPQGTQETTIPEDIKGLLTDLGVNVDENVINQILAQQNQTQTPLGQQPVAQTQTTETEEVPEDPKELARLLLEQKKEMERQRKAQQNFLQYANTNPQFAKIIREKPEIIGQIDQLFGSAIDYTQPTTPHLVYLASLGLQVKDLVKAAFEKGREQALASGGVVAGGGLVGNRATGESGEEEEGYGYIKEEKPSEWI